VKLIRADKGQFVFHVGNREKVLLFEILKLYPLVPASHQRLSKTAQGPAQDENQRLLEEALAEQRRENRKHVLAMLAGPQRFRKTETGFELALSPPQAKWLLQVLNDVRVGCWLALGAPEDLDLPRLDETNAGFVVAMEAAGFFESAIVDAFSGKSPARRGEG
jgi:hypothetical protein